MPWAVPQDLTCSRRPHRAEARSAQRLTGTIMTELPRIRFASSPLAILAVALASGVGLGIPLRGPFTIWICTETGVALTVLSLAFLARKYLFIATVFVISAFCCAGIDLSRINLSNASRNRISTLYGRGE